ncbi:hypothetical protein [Acidocella sp.]|jgi:hypothetical protein|uniref:hypothetical protein n=1 Tax=Acidocella sp. TaxID=50710 RepID=UPI002F3E9CA1
MFIGFAAHVEDYLLKIDSPKYGSVAAAVAPKPAEASIFLNLQLSELTLKQLGFENGEDIHDVVVHMLLKSGQPVFANGEPIVGGCGALWHIPAYGESPTFLSAEVVLPVPEFERVWSLFAAAGALQPRVIASVGRVPFSAKANKWLWNTKEEDGKLLISEIAISFATKGLAWPDMAARG